jgi:hypothetical protein
MHNCSKQINSRRVSMGGRLISRPSPPALGQEKTVYNMNRVTCSDACRAGERGRGHMVEEDPEDEFTKVREAEEKVKTKEEAKTEVEVKEEEVNRESEIK